MNEVARRAKISETTLFSPKQKELGKFVKDWIESLKKKAIVGRKNVQRSHFERSKDWHKKYLMPSRCSHHYRIRVSGC